MTNVDLLTLPGAAARVLRWAAPATGVDNEPERPDESGSTEGGTP